MRARSLVVSATVVAMSIAMLGAGTAEAKVNAGSDAATALSADFTDSQWALTAVRAKDAWTVSTGTGVVVAVIDTGSDASNPDLSGQYVDGATLTFDSGIAGTIPLPAGTSRDLDVHGTHVSGIIAAKNDGHGTTGVAPGAKIMPLPVFDALNNASSLSDAYLILAKGIEYASTHGAKVISMSLGAGGLEKVQHLALSATDAQIAAGEKVVCDAITTAKAAGALTVVAAGNDGYNYGGSNPPSVPANCPDAMSVAAVGSDLAVPADYSSSDPTVNIAAPGSNVLSTVPITYNKDFPYAEMSGTSMATPMTSGVAALVFSAHPDYTPTQVEDAIDNSATDLAPAGRDPKTGFGLLDAAAAVGVDEPRTAPLVEAPYMPFIVRAANSTDFDKYTAVWNTPTSTTLPTDYTLVVHSTTAATPIATYTVPADQVRYTFVAPYRTDMWLTLTANYPTGSIEATPQRLRTNGPSGGDRITGLKVKRTGNNLAITWNQPYPGSNDYLGLDVFGPGIQETQRLIPANADGTFPTSTKVHLTGIDVKNSDIEIDIMPLAAYGMMLMPTAETTGLPLDSKTPFTITNITMAGDSHVRLLGVANYAFKDTYMGFTSSGQAVRLTYTTLSPYTVRVKVKGKWHKVTKWHWVKGQPKRAYIADDLLFSPTLTIPKGSTAIYVTETWVTPKGKISKYHTIANRISLIQTGF